MFTKCKFLVVLILSVTLLFILAACGGSDSAGEDAGAVVEESAAPPEPATVEDVLPEVDTSSAVDGLLGSWKDISDPTLFANITKVDSAYQYEDNDGKYDAVFENGKLKVSVSDDPADFAEVYIDAETAHLCVLYQGGLSEFVKK
jgi:hypothetical protein